MAIQVAKEEVSNEFPVGMVLDDQIFSLSIVTDHRLEDKRESATAAGVEEDAQVFYHVLN